MSQPPADATISNSEIVAHLKRQDSSIQLQPNDFRHLVSFDMRAQSADISRNLDHPPRVLYDPIGINQQRRRVDFLDIRDCVPAPGIGLPLIRLLTTEAPPDDVPSCELILTNSRAKTESNFRA